MAEENIPQANQVAIRQMIIDLRGVKVIIDRDIAKLYGVTTGNLNKAVKRNIERFPERFMFQLTEEENLLFQNGISSWGGTRTLPYAFTEQGVAMLSSVLHSPTAINVSISIIDAFVALRSLVVDNQLLRREINNIELQLKLLQNEQNENLGALNDLSEDVRMEQTEYTPPQDWFQKKRRRLIYRNEIPGTSPRMTVEAAPFTRHKKLNPIA